jgi:branched-chain amino acid transport system permease protein
VTAVRAALPRHSGWSGRSGTVRRTAVAGLAVGALLAVPAVLHGTYLTVGVYAGIFAIGAVGTALLLGTAGLVSLGQSGFFAIGGYAAAILVVRHGWNELAAALAATVVAGLAGAVVGLPLFRLRGHYLSLATLAFTVIVGVVANESAFTGGNSGIYGVPRPVLGRHALYSSADYYRLVWPVALGCALLAAAAVRGRAGRALRAGRDAEVAAASLGVPVTWLRLRLLAGSAALAGLSGALYVYWVGIVTPQTASLLISIEFLMMAVVGGSGPLAAVGGAVFVQLLDQALTDVVPLLAPGASGEYQLVGLGLVLTAVAVAAPGGLAGLLRPARRPPRAPAEMPAPAAGAGRPATPPGAVPAGVGTPPLSPGGWPAVPPGADPPGPALGLRGLARGYGGVRALDGLDLDVWPGEVVALIGPNGAGKTTAFDLASGVQVPSAGTVEVFGRAVRPGRPARVAARGGARTFQNLLLFGSLTTAENVLVGCHRYGRAGLLAAALRFPARAEERALRARADGLLNLLGLTDVADQPVTDLPFGRQRLVEIARALAAAPRLLLLDEPLAGLSPAERAEVGELVRRVAAGGCAVLLVEHDMAAVMTLSHRVVVLDRGRVVASGDPDAVRADPAVIAAYLGDPAGVPAIGPARTPAPAP